MNTAARLTEIAADAPAIGDAVDLARRLHVSGMPLAIASSSTPAVIDAELEAPWPDGRANVDNEMGWVRGYVFGDGITRFNIVHRDRRHAPKDEPVTLEEAGRLLPDTHTAIALSLKGADEGFYTEVLPAFDPSDLDEARERLSVLLINDRDDER